MARLDLSELLVHTHISIEKETKLRALEMYEQSVKACADNSVRFDREAYVTKWHDKVMEALRANHKEWKRDLAKRCDLLLHILHQADRGKIRLAKPDRKHIVAALHYVCDSDDAIPDTELVDGFADDVLVVNQCLKRMAKRRPRLLATLLDPKAKT